MSQGGTSNAQSLAFTVSKNSSGANAARVKSNILLPDTSQSDRRVSTKKFTLNKSVKKKKKKSPVKLYREITQDRLHR